MLKEISRHSVIALLVFTSISYINSQEICQKCNCDQSTGIVDCSSRNLTLQFNRTELWMNNDNETLQVVELNFRNNNLIHLLPFPKLNIKKLDLSFNKILRIEVEAFKELSDLEELDLTNNQLMSEFLTSDVFMGPYAPEDREPLRSLKVLRLSRNLLHTLHPDLFEHTDRIEVLTLDSNPFDVIDRVTLLAIVTLPKLKVLDLSYTGISTLPQFMLHTPKYLTHLNLSGNNIVKLPGTLGDVHCLEWLSLTNNPIENLSEPDNIFPEMPTLKALFMTNMPKLRSIDRDALSGLINLEELHLSENRRLKYVDRKALSRLNEDNVTQELWPPLKIVELQKNNLSYIDKHLIGEWNKLEHIDIRYNSFVCDCDNQWIVNELIPIIQKLHENLTYGTRCVEPIEMRGKNLTDLSQRKAKMRCSDRYGAHPERDGSILVGILIGVLLTVPIMMGIIVFCYKRNLCGIVNVTRNPADFSRNFYKRADMADDQYI